MSIVFNGMPTQEAGAYQAGAVDVYGNAPEHAVSDGIGAPCRHCLNTVAKGAPYLILAYRPFGALQPYAELGPIFLCAEPCERDLTLRIPQVFEESPDYLIKGYTSDERIKYGTGEVVLREALADAIEARLEHSDVAFVDIRSARNNCWLARVTRAV